MNFPHVWTHPYSNPDKIARKLIYLGALARSMPPAWDGAEISHLIAGPDGSYIGKVLPGRGIKLASDLKSVGINKALPWVYEQSWVSRLWDKLKDERGAITTYDAIATARATFIGGPRFVSTYKSTLGTLSIWCSTFRVAGDLAAGSYANITGGTALNNASGGSFIHGLSNPTSPAKCYLLSIGYGTSGADLDNMILADLLVGADNIDTNSNATQTINSTALTRYTSGNGVLMTFEVTAANLGATPANLTVSSYTGNVLGAGQTTAAIAMTTGATINRLQPNALGPFVQLASGDYGVKSVESLIFSAAMGTAGKTLGLNLYYPLAFCPTSPGPGFVERDGMSNIDGLTALVTEAGGSLGCLMAYCMPGTTGDDLRVTLELGIG